MKRKLALLSIALFLTGRVMSQSAETTSGNDFYEMSLEELMNVKVSVASIKALTTRESPGIVTLVTEEEIKNSGARDLMELLGTIPGFDFGVDVEGVIGLGVRGNWAHEGKFLLLLDGQEMNENLFSSVQFGNHYPLENIKQIEIIRGPGSAMYGGFAEYAVINIITRSGEDLSGLALSASGSSSAKGLSGARGAIAIGKKWNDFSLYSSGYSGFAERSDRTYHDFDGNSYSMKGQSGIRNYYSNTALDYKKFQLRMITDIYRLSSRDNYTTATSKAYEEKFDSYFLELKKDLHLGQKLKLYPRIAYKRQLPWTFTGESVNDEMGAYHMSSEKLTGRLAAGYDPSERVGIHGGIEVSNIHAKDYLEGSYFKNGKQEFDYSNKAAFLQTLLRMGFADFTLGARYNLNSRFEPSFLPRIGITKAYKKFHFKCLYSQAFRIPSVENINYGQNIKPEKTAVFEIEGGMIVNEKMMVTVNAYSIRTTNTIIYYYDVFNDEDVYKNFYGSGTQGIELVYKIKDNWGWAEVNYAYYNSGYNFRLTNYSVEGREDVLLGFPAHKINLKGSLKIKNRLNISPSLQFSSAKFGCIGYDSENRNIIQKYPATVIANLYLLYDNFLVKGLQASAGVNNLTNTTTYFLQPYNSLHPPVPGQSREFTIRFTYQLKL